MATKSAGDGGGGRRSRVIYTENKTERSSMRLENPFTFKVGQVFTGFGIGCGVGIGVGRPLHLGIFLMRSLFLPFIIMEVEENDEHPMLFRWVM